MASFHCSMLQPLYSLSRVIWSAATPFLPSAFFSSLSLLTASQHAPASARQALLFPSLGLSSCLFSSSHSSFFPVLSFSEAGGNFQGCIFSSSSFPRIKCLKCAFLEYTASCQSSFLLLYFLLSFQLTGNAHRLTHNKIITHSHTHNSFLPFCICCYFGTI